MRFLLDQGLPRSAAALLAASGHDAVHVGQLGLGEASDAEIVTRAAQEKRVIVTLDADFHSLIAIGGTSGPSAIRIRIEGLGASEVAGLVDGLAERLKASLENGVLVSVSPTRVSVRDLPIDRAGR